MTSRCCCYYGSIIVHFNDDELYHAKLALQSIITHTPSKLYHELILLDDGSKKKSVALHALDFLNRPEFKHVRKFRSEKAEGPSAARFKASKLATGSVLVFVDSEVRTGYCFVFCRRCCKCNYVLLSNMFCCF